MVFPHNVSVSEMSTFSLFALQEDIEAEINKRKTDQEDKLILALVNAIKACADARIPIALNFSEVYQFTLGELENIENLNNEKIYSF